ncbi:methyltransferase domain-containing protein [Agrobacterium vitis]|uniref:class I SAM-dependent methyltransferase n=1 Tax=Rhizobium/Agrobacterium group TaxID=227290 RepID=UPI0008DC2714|nr:MULTISPECIES: class I SAM-dependent methyltransferase [Rhizobium/Agrobacterium group]MCF1435584.1 class I SAM-dependent methyltransferase [Allorhizobium ampelinum]MUO88644.1 methyltransferase domain-containing protein [Agrobacterium vitis]MUZ52193.1 methyltransferase domain-containing protein [Agrobacterium vitis]MUZ91758.1 methyltransferase domain-containing protein [Agrobacterium vitis]MVA39847.1 methyltransferase domain-containing protein [Agrobacterium vitis]
MPVDDAFALHDMAIFYDSFNIHGEDGDFYETYPKTPCRILDIGCGTGSVTLRLAKRGHQVTGIDPAPGMLALAKAKDQEGLVRWIATNAFDLNLDREQFDLIIMTGHVFQVFLDDEETLLALTNACRHLAPGGRMIIESRNPLLRAWEGWTEAKTRNVAQVPGIGPVEVFYQVDRIEGEHVIFDATFTLLETGEQRISRSCLRFPGRGKVEQLFKAAGFKSIETLGWWDGRSFDPISPEIIAIASA